MSLIDRTTAFRNGLLALSLGMTSPAFGYDINTAESVVIIEDDEEAFITFGKREPRQVGPGMHAKIPFLERVGVITTTATRYAAVSVTKELDGGSICTLDLDFQYVIGDARRAFDWRRANGLDMSQQRSFFKEARDDYSEPAVVAEAALSVFAQTATPRRLACGTAESWGAHDPAGLRNTLNSDGTMITDTDVYWSCEDTAAIEGAQCHTAPRLNRSFSSSAQDMPRHMSAHRNQL